MRNSNTRQNPVKTKSNAQCVGFPPSNKILKSIAPLLQPWYIILNKPRYLHIPQSFVNFAKTFHFLNISPKHPDDWVVLIRVLVTCIWITKRVQEMQVRYIHWKKSFFTLKVLRFYIPEPSHGRVFREKFRSVYVVKGVWSLLTDLFLNRHLWCFSTPC